MTPLAKALGPLLGKTITEIEVHTGDRREGIVLKCQDGMRVSIFADCTNEETTYFEVSVEP
jgi:hypothetical protein